MKRLTLIIIALMLALNAGAQETFEKIVHSDRYYMDGISSINDGDGFILSVSCLDPSTDIYSTSLLRLAADGRTTDSIGCQTADGMPICVFDLITDGGETGTFRAAGMSYSEGRRLTDIAVATYDRDLNMTECSVFRMDSVIVGGLDDLTQRAVLNPDGSISIAGHVRLTGGHCGYVLARIGTDGIMQGFKTQMVCDTNYPMFDFFILRENPLEYGITCLGPGTSPGSGIPMLYVYDSDFNETGSRMLSQFVCGDNMPYQSYVIGGVNPTKMLALNDSTCYTFTRMKYFSNIVTNGTGVMRFNRDFEIGGYSFTPSVEGESYERTPFHAAFYLDGEGLVGCATGHSEEWLQPDKFYIVRYDHDLNIVWQRVYRFTGMFIHPNWICGTADGGSLIAGWISAGKCTSAAHGGDYASLRTTSDDSGWRDLYLLKVNGDGVIASDGEIIEAVPFLVYPNPAGNSLHIEISPDVIDQVNRISLHDVSGRLVKDQQSGFGSIDISGLAPGMYVMRVALEDGKVFEEKIVKK